MARPNVEQRLIALNHCAADAAALAPYLRDPSGHVLAKVARRVRDDLVGGVEAELCAAFARCCVDPVDADPGCGAKLAILEALDVLDYDNAAPFRIGARFVQLEPAFDKPVDTAGALRIRGALGLVRLRESDVLTVLTEHLADEPAVQAAAARALAEHGDPAGAHLARLRVLLGAPDAEVLTECYYAQLVLDSSGSALRAIAPELRSHDPMFRTAAALAIGESRLDGAFELLRDFHTAAAAADREVARVALGLLRCDEARDYLQRLDTG